MTRTDESVLAILQGCGNLRRYHGCIQSLTPRELQLLTVLCENGLNNREVAERLIITEGTVKVYLSRIMSKLSIHTRGALIAQYWREWRPTPAPVAS